MSDFTKLTVWQKAHALALEADRLAPKIRGSHRAGLRSQLFRAAHSIPSNIVEGSTQQRRAQFIRFLRVALGSSAELEYHIIFARDVKALPPSDASYLRSATIEVRKMLHGLINGLEGTGDT